MITTLSQTFGRFRWKSSFSGITKALQETVGKRPDRLDREQKAGQVPESQNGAKYPPDHCLGYETGKGAEIYRNRLGRRMCLAEAETQGDENAAH